MDERWQSFLDAREDHLRALGAVVLECVSRDDTGWPVFHGCYDWHSAVHGLYALHALYRLTGDATFLDAADALLSAEAIAGELALVQQGALDHERPYGYAWFLLLAMERERVSGATDLRELADALAERLEGWLYGLSSDAFREAVVSDSYDNLSWALLNLWQFARWRGHAERADALATLASRLLEYDALLPLALDAARTSDFFPPALHRALAIGTILPAEQTGTWAAAFLPTGLALEPLARIEGAHPSGLNFSRPWGLWSLWALTGDETWRTLYLDHVEAHLAQPQYWAEDYVSYSHWVPQFGVYAIALTY